MNKLSFQKAMFGLRYQFLPRAQKAEIAYQVQRQREINKIRALLPGNYRHEQVEAAIVASGVSPTDIYVSLSSSESTSALVAFYTALYWKG